MRERKLGQWCATVYHLLAPSVCGGWGGGAAGHMKLYFIVGYGIPLFWLSYVGAWGGLLARCGGPFAGLPCGGLDGEGHESLPHGVLWTTTAWAELCGYVSAAAGLLWRTVGFGCVVRRGIAFAWAELCGCVTFASGAPRYTWLGRESVCWLGKRRGDIIIIIICCRMQVRSALSGAGKSDGRPNVVVLFKDSLRGSSVKIGTMQRRLALPLRNDDTF